MVDFDLGDDAKITIGYKGKEYSLREPTVAEIESISENQDKLKVSAFLSKLGMPLDVVEQMGVSKSQMLIEKLMNMVTKKK